MKDEIPLIHRNNPISDCLLDRLILVQGEVRQGYGRGSKKLGFPTANLPQFDKQILDSSVTSGVYFGFCAIENEENIYECVCNIGKSPSFVGEENRVNIVETYIIDRDEERGEFYHKHLRLLLIGFLRPEMKFDNLTVLIDQIKSDVEDARRLCNNFIVDHEDLLQGYHLTDNFLSDYFALPFDNSIVLRHKTQGEFKCDKVNSENDPPALWGLYPIKKKIFKQIPKLVSQRLECASDFF